MIVRKQIKWEMGHALSAPYSGKCARCHGHSWEVEFAYEGPVDERGMVIDFSDFGVMKEWIDNNLDHRFLVRDDHILQQLYEIGDDSGIVGMEFNPTSENMAIYLHRVCYTLMGLDPIKLDVTIKETCTSSATFRGDHDI